MTGDAVARHGAAQFEAAIGQKLIRAIRRNYLHPIVGNIREDLEWTRHIEDLDRRWTADDDLTHIPILGD